MKELSITAFVISVGALILVAVLSYVVAPKDHTHEPSGVQFGTAVCLEVGTLHYPHPMDGSDAHTDAVFCGVVVEEPRLQELGDDGKHLSQ